MIYVFVGVMGSGKDFNAKTFMKKSKAKETVKLAFADAVRDMVWTMLKWSPKTDKEYVDFKEKFMIRLQNKKTTETLSGIEGRKFLQVFGTDAIRKYRPTFWVDIVTEKISNTIFENNDTDFFITDCRFENEIQALLKFDDVKFIFCNFKSENYFISDHESEKIAVDILNSKNDFKDLDDITEYMRSTYGDNNLENIREQLSDRYGDLLFMDGGYDDCVLGVVERIGSEPYVLYDTNKIINKMISRDNMTREDAIEYFEFNMIGSYVGERTPGFTELLEYVK